MLKQLLLHCYYIHAIELLVVLFLCCKTRRKMLVFVRPSFSSLFWFLTFSPLYTASPFHLIQMHKCLVADVRLAGMLDTHLCFIPPFVLPDRLLQSTLELRSRSTLLVETTTSRPPLTRTRSSFGGS